MIRTFGVQTLTAASQPWFKDALTAAIVAHPDNTQNPQAITPISVASTTQYREGDFLTLGAGTATQETVMVQQIPSSTMLNVSGCAQAHANGDLIALDILCGKVIIQLLTAAATAYIGTDKTVTNVPGGTAVAAVTPSLPFIYEVSPINNNIRAGDGWIVGTTGNTFLTSAYVV